VRDPQEALAAARRAAAAQPPVETEEAPWQLDVSVASARRLAEWAIIEPERAEVYSTRRFGQPITALKRLLIRLLSQYLGQMSAQQSRFNANIAAHVIRLEERVAELEQAVREHEDAGEPPQP
jgi:hypothetical protein